MEIWPEIAALAFCVPDWCAVPIAGVVVISQREPKSVLAKRHGFPGEVLIPDGHCENPRLFQYSPTLLE